MKRLLILLMSFGTFSLSIAQESVLSVEYIMRDPSWMGTFPSSPFWSEDSQVIYFRYNPENNPADSLYQISLSDPNKIQKVDWRIARDLRSIDYDYTLNRQQRVFKEDQKIYLEDLKKKKKEEVLEWYQDFGNPYFLADENKVAFESNGNLYVLQLSSGEVDKVTNIASGTKPTRGGNADSKKEDIPFLERENLNLLQVVRERQEKDKQSKAYREATRSVENEVFTYYKGSDNLRSLRLSPDGRFATFNIFISASNKRTIVPDYVDASGYTTDLNARSKVGTEPFKNKIGIYDLENDTVFFVSPDKLEGLDDLPDYLVDYPEREVKKENREVFLNGPIFSPDGSRAIVQATSFDHKDRWITEIDLSTGDLITLDRQRDEAWIAGPGIGRSFSPGTMGWLPDSKHIYFQSEESGYSHLYLLEVETGGKTALTSGEYEVFDPTISRDKKHWYLTTSEVDAGERHFYKMPLMGGEMTQLTGMTGNNQVYLSPDEKKLAILYSYSNQPTELYWKENNDSEKAIKLTEGQSEEFKSYSWKDPEIIRFEAEDGAMVPARLYKPEENNKNGAAVIFVHGAGYLQNAHKWWSSYFREYMFHNLLTDLGYTVLDIDYRASAGYGRDWRTGIYRHMGGKDLSDQIDGAAYLIESHGIDKDRLGIYGGSYGGFITLMALFTEPDVFKSGAALRSVTDWAHYNDGYTSNILNTPEEDPIAYQRSSPIYFAEGLKNHLLMAHGMVDVNVHFQDVVRLSQRLIELEKDNWEMAIYPVEDHGFVEPSSWTDEYKRILKLFNSTLLD